MTLGLQRSAGRAGQCPGLDLQLGILRAPGTSENCAARVPRLLPEALDPACCIQRLSTLCPLCSEPFSPPTAAGVRQEEQRARFSLAACFKEAL